MSYHCPSCDRVLYNRRLTHCGFCGVQIPEDLRFAREEIAALDRKSSELEAQRMQRERAAEQARQADRNHGDVDLTGIM